MARVRRLRRDRPYYLIPIMLGMAGVLFSSQLEDTVLRGVVLLLCLAIPLFIGGNLLARVYSDGLQRFLLMAGMFTLTIGAVVTISGYSESLVDLEYVSVEVGSLSRALGVGSLLLGLLVVLYSMVRSEAMIDELGDRFRHVADHIGEGFVLMDSRGTIIMTNKLLTTITGIQAADLIGHKVQELAREFEVEPIARHSDRRSRGLASEYELDWTRDEEELRLLVRESPLRDRRQRRVGTLQTVHDISIEHRLKKRLEEYTQGLQKLVESRTERLHASEKRHRELLMNMQEGFLTIDRELKVRFANDRISKVMRYDDQDLIGRDLLTVVHLEERDRLRGALALVDSQSPQRRDQEYTFVRSDGAYVPVKVSIAAVEETEQDDMYLSLVVTDVHELKEMHRELELRARALELANEELRELDRAKDIFLSNVSHELRTPLGTLDGYIDMLQAEELGDLEAPQNAALEVMARNVDRLSSMIKEMIESSRMEIRGIRLAESIFVPLNLLHECADSAHPQALKRDIGVTVEDGNEIPFMWGDREKVGQALGILVSNAVKFSRDATQVRLSVEKREDGGVAISVADRGIGIPQEYQEQIFRKFYQIDSSLTRHYQGTGIGLSIAKAIMEAHGGCVELDSQPSEGSTFTLLFPGALFEIGDSSEPAAATGGAILLAVQETELATALTAGLEEAGHTVERYYSGYECIRAAGDAPAALILWDESLSDLSVGDARERMRENPSTRHVAFLVLGVTDSDPRNDESQDWEMLEKPFTWGALLERVANVLSANLAQEATSESGA